MPRRKITLDEAFKTIRESGLEVEVKKAVVDDTVRLQQLSDFIDTGDTVPTATPKQVSNKKVKITLYAAHSVSSGGNTVIKDGKQTVEGNGIESYGPGVVIVSPELAEHLLHQDMLARRADDNVLDPRPRNYFVGDFGGGYRGIPINGDLDIGQLMSRGVTINLT